MLGSVEVVLTAFGIKGGGQELLKAFTDCFTEDTQIVVGARHDAEHCTCETAGVQCDHWHHETKAIQDIRVGDWVYSYDTITGVVSRKQVTETIALESDHINYLTIVDENGNEQVIETTRR